MKHYAYTIRLSDTDASGRIYFNEALRIAHESFEQFMADAGHPVAGMLDRSSIGLPVVHASADFREPLGLGDEVMVETSVASIGKTSISFAHDIKKGKSVAVKIKITHVAVSNETGRAVKIPPALKRKLAR